MNPTRAPRTTVLTAISVLSLYCGWTTRGIPIFAPRNLVWIVLYVGGSLVLQYAIYRTVLWIVRRRRRARPPKHADIRGDLPADLVAEAAEAARRAGFNEVCFHSLPCPIRSDVCVRSSCGYAAIGRLPWIPRMTVWIGHRLPRDPEQLRFALKHEIRHLAKLTRYANHVDSVAPWWAYFMVGRYLPGGWWLIAWVAAVQAVLIAVRWAVELSCDKAGVRATSPNVLAEFFTIGPAPAVQPATPADIVDQEAVALTRFERRAMAVMSHTHRPGRRYILARILVRALAAIGLAVMIPGIVLSTLNSTHPPRWLRIWFAHRWRRPA